MSEMLIFDWDGTTKAGKNQVTECTSSDWYKCGTWNKARNWVGGSPTESTAAVGDFAHGTLYIRIEIKSFCASHRRLKLIFNNWQYGPGDGEQYLPNDLQGPFQIKPGTKRTFSLPVARLKVHPVAGPIDWSKPVTRRGVVFKGPSGAATVCPAPFNFRYSVVVVAKGGKFSGWQNYL